MTQLHIGTTLVVIAPLPGGPTGTRRERERQAVASILRSVLGSDVRLMHDDYGAPLLSVAGLLVSVSHSQLSAAVAFDPARPVGIDIEQWRPQLRRVAERFLTPAERRRITSDHHLLRAWTAKEAAFKVAGRPLLVLADFEVSPDWTTVTCLPTGRTFALSFHPLATELLSLVTPAQ